MIRIFGRLLTAQSEGEEKEVYDYHVSQEN